MVGEPVERCLVCEDVLHGQPRRSGDNVIYDCLVCGRYKLTGTAVDELPGLLNRKDGQRAVLSHFIRRMSATNDLPYLYTDMCEQVVKDHALPSPFGQADNLLRWAGENCPGPGEAAWANSRALQAIVGAGSPAGLTFVVDGLFDAGSLRKHNRHGKEREPNAGVTLTFKGWERYDELKRGAHAGGTAFMAMQYNDADLDKMLEECFRPAVDQTGFRLMRLDDDPRAGLIDDRLRVDIQSARFVIVDLTHDNYGAYWEAGYAEGLGKPVIYTCEQEKFEKKGTHFDTNHLTTVPWSTNDRVETAKRLKATIRATIPEARREEN